VQKRAKKKQYKRQIRDHMGPVFSNQEKRRHTQENRKSHAIGRFSTTAVA